MRTIFTVVLGALVLSACSLNFTNDKAVEKAVEKSHGPGGGPGSGGSSGGDMCPGQCRIDGACVEAGTPQSGYPCRSCQPAANPNGWTETAQGDPCSLDGVRLDGGLVYGTCDANDRCIPHSATSTSSSASSSSGSSGSSGSGGSSGSSGSGGSLGSTGGGNSTASSTTGGSTNGGNASSSSTGSTGTCQECTSSDGVCVGMGEPDHGNPCQICSGIPGESTFVPASAIPCSLARPDGGDVDGTCSAGACVPGTGCAVSGAYVPPFGAAAPGTCEVCIPAAGGGAAMGHLLRFPCGAGDTGQCDASGICRMGASDLSADPGVSTPVYPSSVADSTPFCSNGSGNVSCVMDGSGMYPAQDGDVLTQPKPGTYAFDTAGTLFFDEATGLLWDARSTVTETFDGTACATIDLGPAGGPGAWKVPTTFQASTLLDFGSASGLTLSPSPFQTDHAIWAFNPAPGGGGTPFSVRTLGGVFHPTDNNALALLWCVRAGGLAALGPQLDTGTHVDARTGLTWVSTNAAYLGSGSCPGSDSQGRAFHFASAKEQLSLVDPAAPGMLSSVGISGSPPPPIYSSSFSAQHANKVWALDFSASIGLEELDVPTLQTRQLCVAGDGP